MSTHFLKCYSQEMSKLLFQCFTVPNNKLFQLINYLCPLHLDTAKYDYLINTCIKLLKVFSTDVFEIVKVYLFVIGYDCEV